MNLKSENIPFLFVNLINSEVKPEYVILVEKKSQTAQIIKVRYPGLDYEIVKTLPVSTGSNLGDKQIQGDLKTPEGFYMIESYITENDLPDRYGVGAYVLNYPNKMDKIFRKTGSGIWLHGTDEPELVSYDTRGCVRFNNPDLISLESYIELEKTPVIIQETLDYKPSEHVIELGALFQRLLNDWKTAWENLDSDKYLELYHPNFFYANLNMDIKTWSNHKKEKFSNTKFVKINCSDISYLYTRSYLLIRFKQLYFSDKFDDFGLKSLLWIKENEEWKILYEDWKPIRMN